jgi:hypothetical protein
MKYIVLSVVVLLWNLPMDTAANPSQLYDKATLQYWGERYKRSTTKILDKVIWPVLLSKAPTRAQDDSGISALRRRHGPAARAGLLRPRRP